MSHTAIQHIHGRDLMPPLRYATVGDVMHPEIVSCPADATLTEVARLMATHHVHCIAVMGISRDRQRDRLVGSLISDLDVMRAGIRIGPKESVAALALEPMISVDATRGLSEAGELMLKAWRQLRRGDRVHDPAADGGPLDSRGHRRARVGRGMTGTAIACSARS